MKFWEDEVRRLELESDLDYKIALEACEEYIRGRKLSRNDKRGYLTMPLRLIRLIKLSRDKRLI